mmetsp:Transcript_8574/g.17357  ORF Transcript_8574/g.17357 Transcript_8574/m.17357 type:complete len:92 (-) Transcript_8574:184-459(-)
MGCMMDWLVRYARNDISLYLRAIPSTLVEKDGSRDLPDDFRHLSGKNKSVLVFIATVPRMILLIPRLSCRRKNCDEYGTNDTTRPGVRLCP